MLSANRTRTRHTCAAKPAGLQVPVTASVALFFIASNMPSSHAQKLLTSAQFDEYNARVQSAALKTTKDAAGLPSDLAFHRSVDKDFARELDLCSERVLSIMNKLLALSWTGESSDALKEKFRAKMEDQDDLVDRFEFSVIEAMDQLLERAVGLGSST